MNMDQAIITGMLVDEHELFEKARHHGSVAADYAIAFVTQLRETGSSRVTYPDKARGHARLAASHARRALEIERQLDHYLEAPINRRAA